MNRIWLPTSANWPKISSFNLSTFPPKPETASTTSSNRAPSSSSIVPILVSPSSATPLSPSHRRRLVNDFAEPVPPDGQEVGTVAVPRPIDDNRASLNLVVIHESPEAPIVTAVAIVPHHQKLARRDRHRPEIVAR